MEDLYFKIVQALQDNTRAFIEAGLTPVATTAVYNGQPAAAGITCPAVLIDYRTEWKQGCGQNIKKGTVNLELHILPQPAGETTSTNAIKYYDIIAGIIEKTKTAESSLLQLTAEEPRQTEYYCYHILQFTASLLKQQPNSYTPVEGIKPNLTTQ